MSKRDARRNLGLQAAEEGSSNTGLTLEQSVIEGYGLKGIERASSRSLKVTENAFSFGRFTLTSNRLIIPEDTSLDEWSELGTVLFRMQGSMQWLIGDWLVYGERQFQQDRRAIAEHFSLDIHTLDNYAWVARAVSDSLRKESLSFGHHALVAGRSPEEQVFWLDQAEANQWSVAELRKAMSSNRLSAGNAPRLALADQNNRLVMNRVWRSIEHGQEIKGEDIAHLRRWLDEVERNWVIKR